jgi:hypothetical protein
MFRIAALLAFAASLAACDMISTLIDGWKYAKAVEFGLEISNGMKPLVGFNWRNGRLVTVTVTFPRLYDAKPLRDVAETVRAAVGKEFKQTPEDIVLAFSLGNSGAGTVAQLSGAD